MTDPAWWNEWVQEMPQRRPRLLDLMCCAGGGAMGYYQAGFDVVGVDIDPQPNYPFEFYQADALTYPLDGFDVVHASPPCQRYSKSVSIENRKKHPDLIGAIRERFAALSIPTVIENVPRSPLINPITLCGSSFGLEVKRHRLFEMSHRPDDNEIPKCRHDAYTPQFAPAWNRSTPLRFRPISGGWTGEQDLQADRAGMGVRWRMTSKELSEAIPPPYTKWIGKYLLQFVLKGDNK